MEELKKVKRVIGKAAEGAPHEVLLVLDATNGQNAIAQARQFHEALGVTGLVLTKLDGTAKGGVVIGICDELGIPVRFVGIGETVADLKPFAPRSSWRRCSRDSSTPAVELSLPYAVYLFDIDGTLVSAGGAGRRAFERAVGDRCGPPTAPSRRSGSTG